jgi:hypothetical protein
MGLDMYLEKRTFIGAEYKHREVKGTCNITAEGKKIPIKFNRISSICERVGYWRKANQIHAWFVKNVQKGKDDCGDYNVTLEQLKELVATCKTILKNKGKASELLPSQGGFFFGGTDYDEYYFDDLKYTVKMLTPIIKELEKEYANKNFSDLYYQSSW